MATGFECEFVEKPPKAVQSECPICLLVLREPFQATCCGNSFCKKCADRAKSRNQVCPTCNDRNFNLFHNLGLQRSLYDFGVHCTHKSRGCEWTGELRELDNHLNSDPPPDKALQGCPYMVISCPLNCAGCVEGVSRKNCKAHVIENFDEFLRHVMSVDQENTRLKAQVGNIEREKLYLEQENAQLKVQMANNEGEKLFLERRVVELEARERELKVKNERLEQKNMELEEDVKNVNEELSSIKGDNQYLQQQVTELKTGNSKLEETNRELEENKRELENEVKVNQLANSSNIQPGQPSSSRLPVIHVTGTYKPKGAEFTMTDFEEYKRDGDSWFSSYFYTHPNGYKMCLRVDANGVGPGKDTHLSVFVCLMRGEFDDQLKWPFKGEVTFKLLNQEEDKDHFTCEVIYAEASDSECQRVTMGNRSKGKGFFKLSPLTKLQPKYLKNDCINLCVKKVELF